MGVKLIKSDREHEEALARIEELWGALPGTPEGDEFELLVHLVEVYEEENYVIPLPDPVSAIRFRMEQQDLKPADLIPFIGSKSKVSEVLSGKRSLSLAMIRNLHAGLGIPMEVLIQAPPEISVVEAPKEKATGFLGSFKKRAGSQKESKKSRVSKVASKTSA